MRFFSSLIRTDAISDAIYRARRRTALGLLLSVLIHAGLFMLLKAKLDESPVMEFAGKPDEPLQVTFVTPPTPAPVMQPQPPKPAEPQPRKQPPLPKKPAAKAPPKRTQSSVAVRSVPGPALPAPQNNSASAIAQVAPEEDFMTMTNRNRERRQQLERAAAEENAAARAAENPSANDIAKANIAFQDRRGRGTNGVFEIISKGPRVAQYSFRGWTTDQRRSQKQLIEVDAGPGGNVELAVVDSMIALIRKYYSGDFNFDSQRLGRVVTLSARPADTKGLQNFLMNEFFSRGG